MNTTRYLYAAIQRRGPFLFEIDPYEDQVVCQGTLPLRGQRYYGLYMYCTLTCYTTSMGNSVFQRF